MQISGLSASNTFSATDVLAIEINVNGVEKTYKLTGATLAAALASIGSYLKTTDVVNNLTSQETQKPLSAAQGKALNDKLASLFLRPSVIRNNQNAYTANSVKTETFTFTDSQWPDGYNYGGIMEFGSGGGWISICQVTKGTGKTIDILCYENKGTSHDANTTGMRVKILLIKE